MAQRIVPSLTSVSNEYVDIHGRDVKVVLAEQTGDILIPLCEIKSTGFNLFKKSQYDRFLLDDRQFNEEFNLYMLDCAKKYMLLNKIKFREEEVLESIDNCKKLLTTGGYKPQSDKIIKNSSTEETNSNISQRTPRQNVNSVHNDDSYTPAQSRQQPRRFDTQQRRDGPPNLQPSNKRAFPPKNNFQEQNGERRSFPPTAKNDDNNDGRRSFGQNNGYGPRDNKENSQNNLKSKTDLGDQKRDFLPSIELKNSEHTVLVSFVDQQKKNIAWVQDVVNVDLVVKIFEGCASAAKERPIAFKPVYNKVYLAEDDDIWFRCKVISFNPLTVFFLDYGNTKEVAEVREAPEDLAKIPRQAARISFSELYELKIDDEVRVKPMKQFDDGTVYVNILKGSQKGAPEGSIKSSKPQTFFNLPPPVYELQNNQKVMVVGELDGKLILRTKDGFDKLKEIEQRLSAVTVEKLTNISGGQLVLVRKDDGKYYRGFVNKANGIIAEIQFLDYGYNEKVNVSSLVNTNEDLAKQPVTFIISPIVKGSDGSRLFNESETEFISELIKNKTKCTVILHDEVFDLVIGDSTLSEKLNQLTAPSDKVFLGDLKTVEPKLGLGSYICNMYKNSGDIIMAEKVALEKMLEKLIKSEFADKTPYAPVRDEICWGKFQDDFYRCVVVEIIGDKYHTFFVDFGNQEMLTSDDFRKLTDDVKDLPIIALSCRLTGLPDTADIENILEKEIVEGEAYDVEIKRFINDKYDIEIPVITALLDS